MISTIGENQCTDKPPGIQYVEFNPESTTASYIENGFKEVMVGVYPERTHMVGSTFQAQQ